MADQPEEEVPPVEGEEPPVDPPPESEATEEPPPPVEEPPPPAENAEAIPEAEPVEEPPPAENVEAQPEAEPVEEPPPVENVEAQPEAELVEEPPVEENVEAQPEAEPVEEPPAEENVEAQPEAEPVEEPPAVENVEEQPEAELVEEPPPPAEDASQLVETSGKATDSESKPEVIVEEDGAGEAKTGSRRESTQSEVEALTTAQILERLKKSYAQACKTLAVIGHIQRRESVLKLEESQMELIQKFSRFEGHLEQLGLITDQSTQTPKQACECTSVPSEELKPPTPQDNLPQVIICGRGEQVPKIIVCESSKKSNRKKNLAELERERLLNTQKELVRKCELMKENLMFKETMIGNLHRQVRGLQNENCCLRKQLAAKSNLAQDRRQCPGAPPGVCLASCPVHCPGPEPAQEASKCPISQDDPTDAKVQQTGCGPGSICSPKCPNFNVVVVDRSSKEGSKITAPGPESQSEGPSKCPCFKANLPVVTEESKRTQPTDKCNENTSRNVSPPRGPCFKANLPVVAEESEMPQPTDKICNENMSQHVCSTTCPYFKIHVDECRKDSKPPTDGTDKDVEKVEVEIQELNLGSHKDIVPCAGDAEPSGEVCNPRPREQIIMRLRDNKKRRPKQPTFCELQQEYTLLKMDFNKIMAEVMTLRKDIVKQKELAQKACVAQQRAEIETKNMSDILKSIEDKQLMMLVPKERMVEMEQQIVVAKERFFEAQDELEELRDLSRRQTTQLEDYRSKYLQSHEQAEEQKGQIEMLELENSRISENVALEIQHVKNQFEVRLQALAPLPDILKATQEKVQELQRQQEDAARRHEDTDKELQEARARIAEYVRQLDDNVNTEVQGQGLLRKELAQCEAKYNALGDEHAELCNKMAAAEEAAATGRARLTEKLHEVAQLTAALEMLRVESARQVARARERLDAVRDTLHAQLLDMEEQVARSRAVARTARRDRDNVRQRMQCQIDSLCESFEQAQVTIMSLQEQVGFFNDASGRDKDGGARQHTPDNAG